jgi:hypothetical protein
MPQKRVKQEHVSPTPDPKRSRQGTGDAENLSEISLQNILDRRNERLTEITAEDVIMRRHEHLSEVDYTTLPAAEGAISRRSGELLRHNHYLEESPLDNRQSPERGPFKECVPEYRGRVFGKAADSTDFPLSARRRSVGSATNLITLHAQNRASIGSPRRSRSVDDLRGSLIVDEAARSRQSACVSYLTALPDTSTLGDDHLVARSKTLEPRERKKSLLDLKRHFNGGAASSSESTTPFKELISIWSRFPSHNRAERIGSASIGNNVVTQDFETVDRVNSPLTKMSKLKSINVRKPLWESPAARARRSRKGILGKWRRIYRSSSTDLRKYAYNHGHRSSISLGDSPEYPELECLPSEGIYTETDVQRRRTRLNDVLKSEPEHEQPVVTKSRTRPAAVDWGKYYGYGDCVGSLSALKSESDVDVKSTVSLGEPADVKSLDMRDSTVNFQEALGREQQKLKQEIINKIDRLDGADGDEGARDWQKRVSSATDKTTETVIASSIKTRELQIPGSLG